MSDDRAAGPAGPARRKPGPKGPRETCQACCPSCDLHFAGQTAFDRHVRAGRHIDPYTDRDGAWVLKQGTCRHSTTAPDGVTPIHKRVWIHGLPSAWMGE